MALSWEVRTRVLSFFGFSKMFIVQVSTAQQSGPRELAIHANTAYTPKDLIFSSSVDSRFPPRAVPNTLSEDCRVFVL